MRIKRETDKKVLWYWEDDDRDGLLKRFRSDLSDLMAMVEARMRGPSPLPRDELTRLAQELQDAGETLREAMSNCFATAGFLHLSAAGSAEERRRRARHLSRLRGAVGKLVALRRTSVPELQGRQVLLEEIRGLKAIVRLGKDRWATPTDRVVPVDAASEAAPVEALGPKPAEARALGSPGDTVTARLGPIVGGKTRAGPKGDRG